MELLTEEMKKIIIDRKVKFYIINAYEIAHKIGLRNKISTIMQSTIMHVTNIIDYDLAVSKMKEMINVCFKKRVQMLFKLIMTLLINNNYLRKLKVKL